MGQGLARLHLGADIGGQDIDALPGLIRGQRDADAPARRLVRDFEHLCRAGQGAVQPWAQLVKGFRAHRLGHGQPDDLFAGAGKDPRLAAVGKGIAVMRIDMGDMGRDHFGHLTCAGLGRGQDALGLLQGGVGGGQFAVGRGQPFGMVQHLFAQRVGSRPQQRFLTPDVSDVGIDGDPPALPQRRAFDSDPATICALAFKVMRLKGAGLFDAKGDRRFGVVLWAVFAAFDQEADRVFKAGTGLGQGVGQIEHRLILPVADRQPQIGVKDRQGLPDQVQPRPGQFRAHVHIGRHTPALAPPPAPRKPVTFR